MRYSAIKFELYKYFMIVHIWLGLDDLIIEDTHMPCQAGKDNWDRTISITWIWCSHTGDLSQYSLKNQVWIWISISVVHQLITIVETHIYISTYGHQISSNKGFSIVAKYYNALSNK